MFCHFNSSRAIVLLQLGRTEKANPVERQGTQIRDQRRVIPLAHEVFIPAVAARRPSLRVINSSTALLDLKTTPGATGRHRRAAAEDRPRSGRARDARSA